MLFSAFLHNINLGGDLSLFDVVMMVFKRVSVMYAFWEGFHFSGHPEDGPKYAKMSKSLHCFV